MDLSNLNEHRKEEALKFLNFMSNNYKERTILEYMNMFKIMCSYLEYAEFNQEFIYAFLGMHPTKIAYAFIKLYIDFIDTPYKIPKRSGTKPQKEQPILTKREAESIFEYLKLTRHNKGYYFISRLMYECGLRIQEATNVQLQDFYIAEWEEKFTQSGIPHPIKLKVTGKGAKDRIVYVPYLLFIELFEWGKDKKDGEDLFTFNPNTYRLALRQTLIRLGLTKVEKGKVKGKYHPHSFRHTRATLWYKNGRSLTTIQNLLGHKDISTTQGYLQIGEKEALEEEERFMLEEYKNNQTQGVTTPPTPK